MKRLPIILATTGCLLLIATMAPAEVTHGYSGILTIDVVSGVGEGELPQRGTKIESVYPNPFNPATIITYELAQSGPIELAIFDLRGQLIQTLAAGNYAAGPYQATWHGRDKNDLVMSAGTYFCRLVSSGDSQIKKLTLVK